LLKKSLEQALPDKVFALAKAQRAQSSFLCFYLISGFSLRPLRLGENQILVSVHDYIDYTITDIDIT
jgi:hypothetical protein